MTVEHDGNDMSRTLRRHIDLVVELFGIEKQIVKVILYKLQDQYCHKLQCGEVERETSISMQCRVSDCKRVPVVPVHISHVLVNVGMHHICSAGRPSTLGQQSAFKL